MMYRASWVSERASERDAEENVIIILNDNLNLQKNIAEK